MRLLPALRPINFTLFFTGSLRITGFSVRAMRVKLFPLSLPVLLVICSLVFSSALSAQTHRDTIRIKQKQSPQRASIYSAVLPGLGQIYNKKYWKVPVIYTGFGIMYYVTSENTKEYRKFLEAYRYVVNKDTIPINNEYVGRYNEQQLLSGKNIYRRNTELGYIIAGAWYILNIIDASVDAHLFYYDVSEDLSLKLEPVILHDPRRMGPVNGIMLTLRF